MKAHLPLPSPAAQASSSKLFEIITQEIKAQNNWIPFSRFMELALYTPEYGYYTGGSHKIGTDGDFITAPTLTPLFGQTLARQLAELLPQTAGNIYEFGAGTGHLAATLLKSLSDDLKHYYIIELSPELAERQRQFIAEHTTPQLAQKVIHLTELPESFDGIIIGNEVLDAMPIEIIRRTQNTFQHIGVSIHPDGQLEQSPQSLKQPDLLRLAATYFPETEHPYTSELHPAQYAFILTLAQKITRGGMIFIDYGFDAAQYYHPQRDEGTLIAHYRHRSVHDPFFHIGLTDLTSHVNFTDIAQAGTDGGLDLIGYLPQSHFLFNLGIIDLLAQTAPPGTADYLRTSTSVQKLTDQHEMGELFKVIAFGKNIGIDWTGFRFGDICHKL